MARVDGRSSASWAASTPGRSRSFGFEGSRTLPEAPLRTNYIDGHYLGCPTRPLAFDVSHPPLSASGLDPAQATQNLAEFVELQKLTNAERPFACGFEKPLWSLPFFNTFARP
jgi:hypothetical protein